MLKTAYPAPKATKGPFGRWASLGRIEPMATATANVPSAVRHHAKSVRSCAR